MGSHQYNLKWNDHQGQILETFSSLLETRSFVDVTLVCDECTIKAHKIILSACSSYFQRIFMDHPDAHPVVILKDVDGWIVQAIIQFIYKGEVSISEEQLTDFIKAAESLKIKGLTGMNDAEGDQSYSCFDFQSRIIENADFSAFGQSRDSLLAFPRRKQARPQRRTDENNFTEGSSMDASTYWKLNNSQSSEINDTCNKQTLRSIDDSIEMSSAEEIRNEKEESGDEFPICQLDNQESDKESEKTVHQNSTYLNKIHGTQLPSNFDSLSCISNQASNLKVTYANTSSVGIPGIPMFSAPRGGPPRHWSNENLTEALRHVWSGKMKTAQASRIFGIPYNSLLMYVRGKYGKSLRLDLARRGKIPIHMIHDAFHSRYNFQSQSAMQSASVSSLNNEISDVKDLDDIFVDKDSVTVASPKSVSPDNIMISNEMSDVESNIKSESDTGVLNEKEAKLENGRIE